MKGVVQLSIHINFDEIITDAGLVFLQQFTGADTKEAVGMYYMNNLVKDIIEKHLEKDNVDYSVEGNIFNNPSEAQTIESSDEDANWLSSIGEPSEDSYNGSVPDVEKLVSAHIVDVSINKGIPTETRLTAEFYDSLPSNPKAEDHKLINGVKVSRLDNDYVLEIDYEPYEGDSVLETEVVQSFNLNGLA